MKPHLPLLLAASFLGSKTALAAPTAILTKVSGEIEVLHGAQKLKGRDGLPLQNGDRVVVKKGTATVFSLSKPPQILKSGSLTIGSAATTGQGSSLWKGVYQGLSTGLNRRDRRIAATMRPGEIVPLSPVQSLIEAARPRFEWRPGALDARRYEIVVTDAKNAVVWRGETENTSLQYPATAPPLRGSLSWQVSPLRQENGNWQPIEGWTSQAIPFQIATAAQLSAVNANLRALEAQTKGAPVADRILSRAALWNASGFKAAALRELEGAGDAPTLKSFRETLWQETGQNWRLTPLTAPTKTPIGSADAKILAFKPDTPPLLKERKTYVAADGSFSIQIPQRLCVNHFSLHPDMNFTEFGVERAGGARMGLTIVDAKKYQKPGSLLEQFKKTVAPLPTGAKFRAGAPQQTSFRGHPAVVARWTDEDLGWPTVGSWLEWIEGDKKIGVMWGGPQATVADALRPFFETLSLKKTAAPPAEKKTKPELLDEMLTTIRKSNDQMGQINDRQAKRSFRTPQTGAAPQPADLEALDQKRLALPANSHERSEVALEASQLAGQLAWDATQRGDTASADRYFERRSELNAESYRSEIAALQGDIRATDAQIAQWGALNITQEDGYAYNLLLDNLAILKGIEVTAWHDLAVMQRDINSQARTSRQLFELKRTDLESAQLQGRRPEKLWEYQSAIAAALENLGDVAQAQSDLNGGRAYFNRSLEWRRAIHIEYPRRDVYEALRNRAVLETQLGDLRIARDLYEQALTDLDRIAPIRQKEIEAEKDPQIKEYRVAEWVQTRAVILNNIGATTQNLGDYNTAETYLQRALKTTEEFLKTDFSAGVQARMRASTLSNLAVLYADTGQLARASEFYVQSAEVFRSINNDSGLALNLYNSADLDYERGDYAGAASKIATARQLFVLLQENNNVAAADVFASKIANDQGGNARAVQLAQSALTLARTLNDDETLSSAARNLAMQRLNAQGDAPLTPAAKAELEALVKEAQSADARSGNANSAIGTLKVLANVQVYSRDFEGALASMQAAIARMERMRATTSAGDAFSEQESVYSFYDLAVSLLIKLKRPEEAFDMLSRARSKKLRDNLKLSALKSNDTTLQKLLDRAAALDEQLIKTRAQLASETALPTPQRDTAKVQNLTALIASTQQEFFDVSARIKERNPRFEKALALSPRELKKSQRAIPAGALLLQYAVLDDGLYIFAVTRDSLQIFQPKVTKDELNTAIRAYRSAIDADIAHLGKGEAVASIDAPSPLRTASEKLSGWLLAPVQSQIDAARTVAVIPSGELFYLPFHALGEADKEGKWHFLIEDKPLAYLAAGDVLAVAQERNIENEGKGVLAMGDPVGADLPAAKLEVESIARLFPDSRVLTGASASKATLLQPASRDKRVLHLAAHGVLDAARPAQSFIQLSPSEKDDGKLRVGEIYGLDLNKVDLVTLSACRTALGEGEPDGTEISSLAESFSSAGTPSVIASLWNVEDQSTAHLMETFYSALADGTPKGTALQKAQIALLRNPKTRHPVFWAPFELLGDWR